MGAFKAVEYLIDQGYKRIGLLKGDDHCTISSGRAKGYFDALKKHGFSQSLSMVRSSTNANKKDRDELLKEMYSHEKPDAVFTITDYLATGVYEFAQENEIKIPDDLAIIGYSNSDLAEILHPKLTSVEQNGRVMGETAFEYLINQVNDSSFKRNRTFDSELIVRQSSQKKNALPA
jgi:LacI family transcriptional regulator